MGVVEEQQKTKIVDTVVLALASVVLAAAPPGHDRTGERPETKADTKDDRAKT